MAVATAAPSAGPIRVVPATPLDAARFAEALDSQAETGAANNLLERTSRRARAQAQAMLDYLRSTKPYQWVRNMFSTVGRYMSRAANKLGRFGILATGMMVLSSKTGQKAIGTIARWARKAVRGIIDFGAALLWKPLSWFSWTKGAANAVKSAKQWFYDRCHDFWQSKQLKSARRALRYDGVIGHNVQLVSRPIALISLAIAFLSGGWMYGAVAGAAAISLPHTARHWVKDRFEFLKEKTDEAVIGLKETDVPHQLKTEGGLRHGGKVLGKTYSFISNSIPNQKREEWEKDLRQRVANDFRAILGQSPGNKACQKFVESLGAARETNALPFDGTLASATDDKSSPQKATASRDQIEAYLEQQLVMAVTQALA